MPTTIETHVCGAPAAPCHSLVAPSDEVARRLRRAHGQIPLTDLPAPCDAEAG